MPRLRSRLALATVLALACTATVACSGDDDTGPPRLVPRSTLALTDSIEVLIDSALADSLALGSPVIASNGPWLAVVPMRDAGLWFLHADGTRRGPLGTRGRGPGDLASPTSLAFDGDTLLVVETGAGRISRWHPDAGFVRSTVLPAQSVDAVVAWPGTVALAAGTPEHELLVVDSSGAVDRLGRAATDAPTLVRMLDQVAFDALAREAVLFGNADLTVTAFDRTATRSADGTSVTTTTTTRRWRLPSALSARLDARRGASAESWGDQLALDPRFNVGAVRSWVGLYDGGVLLRPTGGEGRELYVIDAVAGTIDSVQVPSPRVAALVDSAYRLSPAPGALLVGRADGTVYRVRWERGGASRSDRRPQR